VLIVDDDPFILDMLPGALESAFGEDGPPVHAAKTPEDALRVLASQPSERFLVLSDYDLRARMTGVDLLERVAHAHPDSIRVLISGHTLEEIGTLDGKVVHGFIEKPFLLHEIVPPLLQIVGRASG
jgi:DNA-binding NtrC family response regulator